MVDHILLVLEGLVELAAAVPVVLIQHLERQHLQILVVGVVAGGSHFPELLIAVVTGGLVWLLFQFKHLITLE